MNFSIHPPPYHILRSASPIRQNVRILATAAAALSRSPEVNPILEETTLPQMRNLNIRIGTPLDTTSMTMGQEFLLGTFLFSPTVVSNAHSFVLSSCIELFVGGTKLPSAKWNPLPEPAIGCLSCREHKVVCRAPPVGSADTTCGYVCPFDLNRGN